MFKNKKNKTENKAMNDNVANHANVLEFFNSTNSEETIKSLNENWSDNPYRLLASLINSAHEDSNISLFLVIIEMLRYEYITYRDLAILGIETDEIASLLSAYADNDLISSLREDLHVRAAVREYDRVIIEIINENNLNHDLLSEIRACLANIAVENSISDLKVAYKYIQATEPEKLKRFQLS
jgi:hypothetical protein